MKKIILFIFLFVGIISSQTTTPQKNRIDGKYTQWKSAGGDTVSTGVHLTNGTLPLGTGGATSANQSTQITRADTTINIVKNIRSWLAALMTYTDGLEAQNDTSLAVHKNNRSHLAAIKTAVELIDNAIDGNYLNTNVNFAGVDASVNTGNADATTQRVVLASDQPTIPVTLSPLDTVTVKKVIDALPAGTNIIGKVEIDQTTPGTTNKVSIGTDGTVTANAGTNLNTSLLALETGGNLATIAGKDFATQTTLALIKAKTDNIDNATSTLATTANQTNGTQTSRAVSYSSGGYGTFSVSTVDTLSGTSVPCSEVEITNNTAGSTLYVGFDGSTSTSNGLPLGYRDSYRLKITNLNKIYLVGSTTIDVRYVYTNY